MSRPRWWELGTESIDAEEERFAEAGLNFVLDGDVLATSEAVVFRGELRLGRRRTPASVLYPPSYSDGGHPTVVAPELNVGRHITPDGELCLDHTTFGGAHPMTGAEAVLRAERLWWLWEKSPGQLADEEVAAPDPRSNYFGYVPESAVVFGDVELKDAQRGYFRVEATRLQPLRGAVTEIRATEPAMRTLPIGVDQLAALRGTTEVNGVWFRSDTPPPTDPQAFASWLEDEHRLLVDRQLKYATGTGIPGMPALFGVVFTDEGRDRGETFDAWAVFSVAPDSAQGGLARPFWLRTDERWLRQPQLSPLGDKTVCVAGVGALGSCVVDLLARAGVGRLKLVDRDYFSVGNRVRHALDLRSVGRTKTTAIGEHARLVNPWSRVSSLPFGIGSAGGARGEGSSEGFDRELVNAMLDGTDLIVNATVHDVTSSYISRIGAEAQIPVLHTWVSAGAWGARMLLQRPSRVSGCWNCLGLAQTVPEEYGAPVVVPELSEDPRMPLVTEQGCADPTFTGAGFDIVSAAAAAARAAVGLLLAETDGYPPPAFDLATLTFRTAGKAEARTDYSQLPAHPGCSTCRSPQ